MEDKKNIKRKHFNIPKPLFEQVEAYQEEQGHTTLTSAFFELVRIGLEASKKKKEEGKEA
jgi:hypothetical protein